MPDVSLVLVTHRPEPRFDWFADSLAHQLGDDDPEVIIVDGFHSATRTEELDATVGGRFRFLHVPPKPTPWNGPYRLTGNEYFAVASARNTAIVHATAPYVAFVDDCAVMMPGWWDEVRLGARHGQVVAGAYEKVEEIGVENGVVVAKRKASQGRHFTDVRWDLGDDSALTQVTGGQLYTCSFGAPRELLVAVNGFDELCDPARSSDCHLGIRLEWAGERILYSRRMLTVETMAQYEQPSLPTLLRTLDPEAYMSRLREFGVDHRTFPDEWSNQSMIFDLLHGSRAIRSVGNQFDLATLKPRGLEATVAGFPREFWFDGTPIADL